MTNARKHGPGASVRVSLGCAGDGLEHGPDEGGFVLRARLPIGAE